MAVAFSFVGVVAVVETGVEGQASRNLGKTLGVTIDEGKKFYGCFLSYIVKPKISTYVFLISERKVRPSKPNKAFEISK